jgi:D-alanyl-lipoteichoic acid acyltransferase DltB (MBOAT superfamily)
MRTYLNLMVTMLLGGLWHGAAWNFVLWGLWHGLGLAVQRAWSGDHPPPAISKTRRTAGWIGTLLFVLYGWLLFRARSFTQIADMTRGLLDWSAPEWTASFLVNLVAFGTPLVCMELWQFKSGNRLIALTVRGWAKTILQGTLLIAIVMFWERKGATFIYFQF